MYFLPTCNEISLSQKAAQLLISGDNIPHLSTMFHIWKNINKYDVQKKKYCRLNICDQFDPFSCPQITCILYNHNM